VQWNLTANISLTFLVLLFLHPVNVFLTLMVNLMSLTLSALHILWHRIFHSSHDVYNISYHWSHLNMLGQVVAFINHINVFGIPKNFIILYTVSLCTLSQAIYVHFFGITLTSANQCHITMKMACIQFNLVLYYTHVNSWHHLLKPCTQMNVKKCDYK
jgi:hypothetical protein